MASLGQEEPVGALLPHGAYESFRVRVAVGAAGRNPGDRDALAGEDGVEGRGELRVTVPDQVGEVGSAVAELPEQLASLLGGSGGGVRQMRDRAVSVGEAGFTRSWTRCPELGRAGWMMGMAVSIATDTVRAAASVKAYRSGEKLLTAGSVRNLEPGFGGANADVVDGTRTWQVWVGVVGRALTGECDCPDSRPTVLCPHTIAAALAAVRAGFTWNALHESRPDVRTVDPAERRFRTLARTLDRRDSGVRDRALSLPASRPHR
ncbi:hypothetical protein [Kitasatospora sp. NPDC093102]|uniref:hypothetical protein n=1 Tax=Kitasatospora sp. NPDC093102 TaxID=3155069 RepID=UPI00341F8C23